MHFPVGTTNSKGNQEELGFGACYCSPSDGVGLDQDDHIQSTPSSTDTTQPLAGVTLPSVDVESISSTMTTTSHLSHTIPPSMDDLLHESFYLAIKCSVSNNDLPMLTSTFYRSHVIPQW